MKIIDKTFKLAKKKYDNGHSPLEDIIETSALCIKRISNQEKIDLLGPSSKQYTLYLDKDIFSRPFIKEMFISSVDEFRSEWSNILSNIDTENHIIDYNKSLIDRTLYTTIMAFSLGYDLFKNSSRKTPGTYYEVILGSILSLLLPEYERKKHIKIPESDESLSTDIVFEGKEKVKLVIPAKITTRERVVQPYAHQRILNSVFGEGEYKSILVCVSETQREQEKKINDICVPGTIALFQKHLAALSGIYYLDPPSRYLEKNVCDLVPVKKLSELFCGDLPLLLEINQP